ncbi:MAG: PhzF family phenazine biosynthesis protein [Bacteroidetes bacterium]|nr:MAG: PhzF family phenazine biosynthesis protein [Bacteroidota bacterium]
MRSGEWITLDFPADTLREETVPVVVSEAVGKPPAKTFRGKSDYLLVYEHQEEVASLAPDFSRLAGTGARGVIATAPGRDVDFVSRFFAPGVGINEDPVTGSAHTTLTPYWAKVLGKVKLKARQISARKGELECELAGDRVRISGRAVTYMIGDIL